MDCLITVIGSVFNGFGIVATSGSDIIIDWGDKNKEIVIGTGVNQDINHKYNSPENKNIVISGEEILELNFGDSYAPNQLLRISNLPDSLILLGVVGQLLIELPPLPQTLESLSCRQNQITDLPELPQALQFLNCGNNQLTELPNLPPLLSNLSCRHNKLTTIPTLPLSLLSIKVIENQISVSEINQALIELDTNGQINGTIEFNTQTPSAPPSGLGIIAKANLISKGWTIITD